MSKRPLQTFKKSDPFESIMAALQADGGAIVTDFIDQGLLGRLNAQLRAHVESTGPGADKVGEEMGHFWGSRTKRFTRNHLGVRVETPTESLGRFKEA